MGRHHKIDDDDDDDADDGNDNQLWGLLPFVKHYESEIVNMTGILK